MPKTRAENASSHRHRNSRRWTIREAKKVLKAQVESGLTVAAFAEREGLDAHRLYRWRRHLSVSAVEPPMFEEIATSNIVSSPSDVAQPAGDRLEIVLRSGLVVRVTESFDAGALRRLLDVVDEVRAC